MVMEHNTLLGIQFGMEVDRALGCIHWMAMEQKMLMEHNTLLGLGFGTEVGRALGSSIGWR
jgi:hypothetical protein